MRNTVFQGSFFPAAGEEYSVWKNRPAQSSSLGNMHRISLKDQYSRTFDLLEQMGKRVLLSFHPLAWTDFCAAQMTSLEENQEKFGVLNTVAVGISVD